MKNLNKYDDIDKSLNKEIYYWSRKLVRNCESYYLDIEDIQQDLFLHYFLNTRSYNPSRANLRTFINNILKNKCKDIIRKLKSNKRNLVAERVYLKELSVYLPWENLEKCVEFNISLKKLPPRLSKLLTNLRVYKVTELSKQMKISRATIYADIKKIRDILSGQKQFQLNNKKL